MINLIGNLPLHSKFAKNCLNLGKKARMLGKKIFLQNFRSIVTFWTITLSPSAEKNYKINQNCLINLNIKLIYTFQTNALIPFAPNTILEGVEFKDFFHMLIFYKI